MKLNERSKQVLKEIVVSYIKTALPIGSQAITKGYDFGVGPATIRKIMADLEEEGYLTHPHTSSGRMPTEKGYRFYIDNLLQEETFLRHKGKIIQKAEKLVKREDASTLMQDTSKLLSELTHYIAIVTTPTFSSARIKHIEFIRIRTNCIMAIAVSEAGFVQNKFFDVTKDIPQKELNRISDYLNGLYKGATFFEIRKKLKTQMAKMKDLYDHLHSEAFDLTRQAINSVSGEEESEIYMDGDVHILDLPDFADYKVMKDLLKAVKKKKAIVQLLDKFIGSEGVQVFIGAENRLLGNHQCSLVVSKYKQGDRVLGALGVIGPTRMDYSKVIPVVEATANKVSKLLEAES
ncbi:MAG: heat-inducible transcriptional repressor HrcA [Nitrospiria bacterium]